jgi:hypothetical protein
MRSFVVTCLLLLLLSSHVPVSAAIDPCNTLMLDPTFGAILVSPLNSDGCTEGSFVQGEVITLIPTVDAGKAFTQWSGDVTGSANPLEFSPCRRLRHPSWRNSLRASR